jgi:hypothetical protein
MPLEGHSAADRRVHRRIAARRGCGRKARCGSAFAGRARDVHRRGNLLCVDPRFHVATSGMALTSTCAVWLWAGQGDGAAVRRGVDRCQTRQCRRRRRHPDHHAAGRERRRRGDVGALYFSVLAAHSDRTAALAALAVIGLTGLVTAVMLHYLRHIGTYGEPGIRPT